MTVASVEKNVENKERSRAIKEIEKILEGKDYFTEKLAAKYMLNLVEALDPQSSAAYRLCATIEAQEKEFEVDGKTFPVKRKRSQSAEGEKEGNDLNGKENRYYDTQDRKRRNGVVKEDWELLRTRYEEAFEEADEVEPDELYNNLMRLATHLGLDEDEREILTFVFVAECDLFIGDYLQEVCDKKRENTAGAVAYMLGKPELYKKVQKLFSKNGALVKNGLVYYDDDMDFGFLPEIDAVFWEALSGENMTDDEIIGGVLGKATSTELTIDDFEHHKEQLEYVLKIVRSAVESGETGINILLHGPAGGGKTEMAKAIAQELNLRLYSIGEDDAVTPEGAPPRDYDGDIVANAKKPEGSKGSVASRRMAQLRRAQALLAGNKESILLFDEMEDLLIKGTDSSKAADTESKIETNRMTENNAVVTIWGGNDVAEKFHKSMQQRFTYNIHVDYPPAMILRNIWKRQLGMNKVELPEDDVRMLARKYNPAPRMIAKAAKSARLTGGGLAEIEESLRADSYLAYGTASAIMNPDAKGRVYKPSLLDSASLETMESLIARGRARKPFALTVEGAEGIGISSMLQHMGEEMSRTVVEVDVAALVTPGPMAPPPEDRIRGAFNQAADNGYFMVFKNAEDLAVAPVANWAKWKEGHVGVFLDCARDHKVPFAVTTNKKDILPEEFRHEFSHAIKMDALDDVRAAQAFEYFFDREAPQSLADVKSPFVGDFEKVAALMTRLDHANDDDSARVDMLKKQVLYRSTEGFKIGF